MRIRAKALLGLAMAMLVAGAAPFAHASAPAGTAITNVATIQFIVDGQTTSLYSNAVTTRIDEVLGVALTPKSDSPITVPTTGLASFGVPIILTNHGNGTEAFDVKAEVPGQAVALWVAIDVDGNGAYDPAIDIDISSNSVTPALAPGASVALLLRFASAPSQSGTLTVEAHAASGTGALATVLPGKGDGGTDAIVGPTDEAKIALAFDTTETRILSEPATLTKSQSVRAIDGSAMASSGAIITYRLTLATTGTATLADAEIADAIPAGTTYVPGSLTLDAVAMSDARDTDAALFDGAAIHVALGDIDQPTTRVVTFQVKIQ